MTPFQSIHVMAATSDNRGPDLVGVSIVTLVVIALVGAAIWGAYRLRSVQPVLKKGVSGLREERFAAEVLRDFRPDIQQDLVGAQGSAPEPAARSNVGPVLADEGSDGGVAMLQDFYAKTLTPKPVKTAGPSTGTLTSGGSRPELPGVFGESVREFVEGIRDLATAVEQAALVGGGSDLDRAARSVEAFTSGLGALPIKDVLVSAGRSVEAGGTGRDTPQEIPA